ncbi:MAG: response regulator [Deltaproteobacteria bacterium]|nr:response regulator [Deltaproteobacteria bacterium]
MTRPPILLVEDDPTAEKLALRALARAGCDAPVWVARDGVEALEQLVGTVGREPPPLPALVLLDLKLPRIDGLEVLRRVRADARARFVPIVVLTASREERDLLESYRLGANAYVRKPLDFGALTESMRALHAFWLGWNEPAPWSGP